MDENVEWKFMKWYITHAWNGYGRNKSLACFNSQMDGHSHPLKSRMRTVPQDIDQQLT